MYWSSTLLIAGDLNADPAVNPCLAKGISACRFVDLALAYSRGAGVAPDATCKFSREGGAGSRRDFLLAVPMRWLRLMLALLLIGGSLLHFSVLARFCIDAWMANVACPVSYVNLSGLLVSWILLIGPPHRLHVLSRMSGMYTGRRLGWFQLRLYLLSGMRSSGLL